MLPLILFFFFFFNDTATTEIYTLSLHDALPIELAAERVYARQEHRVACGADVRLSAAVGIIKKVEAIPNEDGVRVAVAIYVVAGGSRYIDSRGIPVFDSHAQMGGDRLHHGIEINEKLPL